MRTFALQIKAHKNEPTKHNFSNSQGSICQGYACFVYTSPRFFSVTTKAFYASGLITKNAPL